MSVGEDRLALGEERREIFTNYCNHTGQGYRAEQVLKNLAEEYCRSPEGVWRDISLVAKKIREYRHRRCLRPVGIKTDARRRRVGGQVEPHLGVLPPVPCETEAEITSNRRVLLDTLEFLTAENLSSDLLFIPRLATHAIENINHLQEAAHATHAKMREVK